MKKSLPWILALTNILIAISFCVAFFVIMRDLPDIIPTHWSTTGGIDKWGAKTELYPLAIIPTVVAGLAFFVSITVLIKNKINAIVYICNGISLFLLIIMILASALMINQAI